MAISRIDASLQLTLRRQRSLQNLVPRKLLVVLQALRIRQGAAGRYDLAGHDLLDRQLHLLEIDSCLPLISDLCPYSQPTS